MRVLVLGSTGNFGSSVVQALLAHNHKVVVLVRSVRKLNDVFPDTIVSKLTVITGDATDSSAVSNALVQNSCDAFVNTAGLAAIFPGQAPKLQGIVDAVAVAAVDASKKLGRPLRCYFMGGMTALDLPGSPGTTLRSYFPLFPEHGLTFARLRTLPPENVQWSLLCPSVMAHAQTKIELLEAPRKNSLAASADIPPMWQNSMFHSIPFFGPLASVFGNALKYNVTLEDAAEFLVSDIVSSDSKFVGHRVGLVETSNVKNE